VNSAGNLSGMNGAAAEGNGHAIHLTIPAKPEYITLGRLALTGLGRVRPLSEDVLGDLKLAITEACTNSVRHAYQDQGGAVEIVYELHRDRIVVEVVDRGGGFSPAELDAGFGDDLSEGGLGIAIIRSLTDELEIGPMPGAPGSRLRFVKFLGTPE
jgi:serine/threonine-protein kinase RsbW